jgi:cytochrome c-type biogenesis protein CcmH
MHRFLPVIAIFALFFAAGVALAAAPIEELEFASPELEERYDALIDEMRCPMCLNSNVAGSDAPIAADLRAETFRQLHEGRSDDEIMAFMKARYGDFISYRPPLNRITAILWFGPLVLLLAGFWIVRRMLASVRASATETALSPEELSNLKAALNEDKELK